jgi:hypothetical protein
MEASMKQYSRRQVLTGMSAGLAFAGVAATLPAGTASAAAAALVKDNAGAKGATSLAAASGASLGATAEPVVAYLRDARSGEISLFVGSREITLHDPDIAAKLAAAASKEA